MLKFSIEPYSLRFRETAITSRQRMNVKETFFLRINDENHEREGLGEIPLFRGLSAEDSGNFEEKAFDCIEKCLATLKKDDFSLQNLLKDILDGIEDNCLRTVNMSSVKFGMESALLSMLNVHENLIFPSFFTAGDTEIPINGLIWMGDYATMMSRIDDKVSQGFSVIKLKIGGINFDDEVRLLKYIRKKYADNDLIIRLDANGSFSNVDFKEALSKLSVLAGFEIHSIEQPFKVEDVHLTAKVIEKNIIPVAVDEQLIGVKTKSEKEDLISSLNPDYIVLKPSLCGGFTHASQWIDVAERANKGWWITSALESAVGLNAIAQFTAKKLENRSDDKTPIPQGLGTGELYLNDYPSSLKREGEWLRFKV